MSRRAAGLCIIAVVLLAAVTIPRVSPTKIGGIAQVGPAAPGPPAVGDCLLGPVGPADGALNGQLIYPPVTTGACAGERFGEVVAVIPASKIQPGTRSATGGSVDDPNQRTCQDAAIRYLGIQGSSANFPLGGGWLPLPAGQILVAGPTATQKGVGQQWIACIQYIDPTGEGHPRPADYSRTAKNAYSTGSPPAAFATCLQDSDQLSLSVVDCHQPHPAELFGIAFGTATTSKLPLSLDPPIRVGSEVRRNSENAPGVSLLEQRHRRHHPADTGPLQPGMRRHHHRSPQTRRQPARTGPTTHPLGLIGPTRLGATVGWPSRVELGQSSSKFRVRSISALIRASISSIVRELPTSLRQRSQYREQPSMHRR